MNKISDYVQGACLQMCPKEEIEMREREGLLHRLEILPGTERQRKPKADKSRMVKSFSRSAAGVKLTVAKNLRPAPVLRETISYLLHDIVTVQYLPFHVIYDFILDRLRAVRQDMIIQNFPVADSISILQPIVRFHAYAAYRLCEENLYNFDPIINKKHLEECLKRLLVMYDDRDFLRERYLHQKCSEHDMVNLEDYESLYALNRADFEALYVIVNLGDFNAITRALKLPKIWKSSSLVEQALQISLQFLKGNWVRTCRLTLELPPLCAAVMAAYHLPRVRRKALESMSVAYSSKNLGFPIECAKKLLLCGNVDDILFDCKHFGIICDDDTKTIRFLKDRFSNNVPDVKPRHELFVDQKLLKHQLPSLLLYDNNL